MASIFLLFEALSLNKYQFLLLTQAIVTDKPYYHVNASIILHGFNHSSRCFVWWTFIIVEFVLYCDIFRQILFFAILFCSFKRLPSLKQKSYLKIYYYNYIQYHTQHSEKIKFCMATLENRIPTGLCYFLTQIILL